MAAKSRGPRAETTPEGLFNGRVEPKSDPHRQPLGPAERIDGELHGEIGLCLTVAISFHLKY
jgi:hypothetical protein